MTVGSNPETAALMRERRWRVRHRARARNHLSMEADINCIYMPTGSQERVMNHSLPQCLRRNQLC